NIGVVSLDTGEKKILIEGGSSAKYSPSGHLIYARGGKLLAVAFDPEKLQVTGEPFPVVDGVFMSANTGMAAYSISSGGHLVYAARSKRCAGNPHKSWQHAESGIVVAEWKDAGVHADGRS